MSSAELLIWGVVLHLVADWLLQNEWMAVNKISLKHPAAYVHSGIHGAVQLLIFPWWAAALIAVTHLLIDTRRPLAWWSKLIRQTQPNPRTVPPLVDLGIEVRVWADQVLHIATIALVALAVSA